MECSDRGDADTDLHIICLPSSRLRWQWKIPLYSGNTPSNARFPIDITVVILPERNKINCYFQTAPNSDRHSSAPFCLKEHVFKILCGPGHRGIDHGKMKHWNWWLKQSLEFQRGDWAQLGLYKHENIHWDWNGFQKRQVFLVSAMWRKTRRLRMKLLLGYSLFGGLVWGQVHLGASRISSCHPGIVVGK